MLNSAAESNISVFDSITDFGTGIDTLTLTGASGYSYVGLIEHALQDVNEAITTIYANLGNDEIGYFTFDSQAFLIAKGAGTGTSYDQALIQLNNTGFPLNYLGLGVFQSQVLLGTEGIDTLSGTSGADIIDGLDGDDTITGNGGDDTLLGGAGNDSITVGFGNDYVHGGEGDDLITANGGANTLYGGDGYDVITGGANNDFIDGGADDDTVTGGTGNDVVFGGDGYDTLHGNAGDDILWGEGGDDYLFGDNGVDTLIGGVGNDQLTGGADSDVFVFNSNLESGDVINDFTAGSGAGADVVKLNLQGSGVASDFGFNVVYDADPIMVSAASGDVIGSYAALVKVTTLVDDCSDLINAVQPVLSDITDGNRNLMFLVTDDWGNSALWYREYVNSEVPGYEYTLVTEFDGVTVDEFVASNFVDGSGTPFYDDFIGTSGDDTIYGGTGTDIIDGGDGNDTIYGLRGVDTLLGGAGDDVIIVTAAEAGSTLSGGAGVDSLTFIGEGDLAIADMTVSGFEAISFEDVDLQSSSINAVNISASLLLDNYAQVPDGFSLEKSFGPSPQLTISLTDQTDVVDLYDNMSLYGFQTLITDGTNATSGISATVMQDIFTQTIKGSDFADTVELATSLNSDQSLTINFGSGDDVLEVTGGSSKASVAIDGGAGSNDQIVVYGTASLGISGFESTITGVETIDLSAATTSDAIAHALIDGIGGSATVQVTLKLSDGDYGQVTYGVTNWDSNDSLNVIGSSTADTFVATMGGDTLTGGGGSDTLTGGAGADLFNFSSTDTLVSSLGTDTITDFTSSEGDKIALSTATFSGLTGTGSLIDSTNYFEENGSLQSSYGAGAGIVVVGAASGAGGVDVYYCEDLSNTSSNSYQIATLEANDTSTLSAADFTKVA